jgi:phosphoribosylformylglycinamidine cyclo-ligase
MHEPFPDIAGSTVADVLLKVHRSYLPCLRPVLDGVHAMAHITGGGLPGNLNRALPTHLDAFVETSSWTIPTEFQVLQYAGVVSQAEMFRAFNMGVGMVVIAPQDQVARLIERAAACDIPAWELGRVRPGSGVVRFNGEVL